MTSYVPGPFLDSLSWTSVYVLWRSFTNGMLAQMRRCLIRSGWFESGFFLNIGHLRWECQGNQDIDLARFSILQSVHELCMFAVSYYYHDTPLAYCSLQLMFVYRSPDIDCFHGFVAICYVACMHDCKTCNVIGWSAHEMTLGVFKDELTWCDLEAKRVCLVDACAGM